MIAVLLLAMQEFVTIPAPGSFLMGCEEGYGCAKTLPRKRVAITRPYRMAKTEVTVKQFEAFVRATGYKTDAEKKGDARTWRSPGFAIKHNQPVVFVTLNDAGAYCGWAGGYVPSEAEWEYAARAGAATHHFWGEEIDGRYLWFRENSKGRLQPVGRKKPNAWGLYDVEGNVWEWVTGEGPYTSVQKPGFGSVRGGGYMTCPEPYAPRDGRRDGRQINLSVPFLSGTVQHFAPDWRRHDGGFRCAAPAARELKDIEFAKPDGVSLTLDAWIPHSERRQGAVILVHGGGWEAGDKRTYIRPWFDTLTEAGIAWFTINYRLGPRWKHPAAVEDIEAAVRWVQSRAGQLGIDAGRLALMGESAGGHLAALAALRGRVRVAALVSFYGVHDVALWSEQRGELPRNIFQYLPDTSPAALREASPVSFVRKAQPPMLLVHGTADRGVPWQQSERLCDASKRAGAACEMLLIDGAPHGVESWEKEARFQVWKPKLTEWLRTHHLAAADR